MNVSEKVNHYEDKDLFISYSRQNKQIVSRICSSILERGITTWIDWASIPPSEKWLASIKEAIDQCQIFIFVVSQESINSRICIDEELARALESNKKIIPVVIQDFGASFAQEIDQGIVRELRSRNFIYLRETDNFYNGIEKLETTIRTDYSYIKKHTHYLGLARSWETSNESPDQLLRGKALTVAQQWLTRSINKDPRPSSLQISHITASERFARKKKRVGLVFLLVILSTISGALAFAVQKAREANIEASKTKIALAMAKRSDARGKMAMGLELLGRSDNRGLAYLVASSKAQPDNNPTTLPLLLYLAHLNWPPMTGESDTFTKTFSEFATLILQLDEINGSVRIGTDAEYGGNYFYHSYNPKTGALLSIEEPNDEPEVPLNSRIPGLIRLKVNPDIGFEFSEADQKATFFKISDHPDHYLSLKKNSPSSELSVWQESSSPVGDDQLIRISGPIGIHEDYRLALAFSAPDKLLHIVSSTSMGGSSGNFYGKGLFRVQSFDLSGLLQGASTATSPVDLYSGGPKTLKTVPASPEIVAEFNNYIRNFRETKSADDLKYLSEYTPISTGHPLYHSVSPSGKTEIYCFDAYILFRSECSKQLLAHDWIGKYHGAIYSASWSSDSRSVLIQNIENSRGKNQEYSPPLFFSLDLTRQLIPLKNSALAVNRTISTPSSEWFVGVGSRGIELLDAATGGRTYSLNINDCWPLDAFREAANSNSDSPLYLAINSASCSPEILDLISVFCGWEVSDDGLIRPMDSRFRRFQSAVRDLQQKVDSAQATPFEIWLNSKMSPKN